MESSHRIIWQRADPNDQRETTFGGPSSEDAIGALGGPCESFFTAEALAMCRLECPENRYKPFLPHGAVLEIEGWEKPSHPPHIRSHEGTSPP